MHIVMNMSSYEIESNSTQENIADAMISAGRRPVDVHLCRAEHSSQAKKLTTLPANLAVVSPDLFLQTMVKHTQLTRRI
jgi:hypothetical protein